MAAPGAEGSDLSTKYAKLATEYSKVNVCCYSFYCVSRKKLFDDESDKWIGVECRD